MRSGILYLNHQLIHCPAGYAQPAREGCSESGRSDHGTRSCGDQSGRGVYRQNHGHKRNVPLVHVNMHFRAVGKRASPSSRLSAGAGIASARSWMTTAAISLRGNSAPTCALKTARPCPPLARRQCSSDTIELALTTSGCDQAVVRHKPRLLRRFHAADQAGLELDAFEEKWAGKYASTAPVSGRV